MTVKGMLKPPSQRGLQKTSFNFVSMGDQELAMILLRARFVLSTPRMPFADFR